jgi:D-alanine transaminase
MKRIFRRTFSTSTTSPISYLNGSFLPLQDCKISVEDRGFVFADGLYEVTKGYSGKLFTEDLHLARLLRGLSELRIGSTDSDRISIIQDVKRISKQLLEKNNLMNRDSTVYVQVTRGTAPRAHAFPLSKVPPNLFLVAKPFVNPPSEYFEKGVSGLLTPDQRWKRCDIKSISLLPNILANQLAKEAGAYEAILTRNCGDEGDMALVEASHSNVFAVKNGVLITHPASDNILSGITRHVILKHTHEIGVKAIEAEIRLSDIRSGEITELFTTATTTEAMPIVKLNSGLIIGNGHPGPITNMIRKLWPKWVEEEVKS